jgi:hypothetical protein
VKTWQCLEQAVESALPGGPAPDLLAFLVDKVPVEFTATSVDVHLSGSEPALALPEVADSPEGSDDEEGKVGREEVGSGTDTLSKRRDGSVELVGMLDSEENMIM